MAQWNQISLLQLLNANVAELRFVSRETGNTRRMLCTNNKELLNSIPGKTALHFASPKGVGLKYNPADKGLVVTWDLFWQDYRQIPLETANVLMAFPLTSEEEITKFWEFFTRTLENMDSWEKMQFMKR